jgi:small-conductance mechanosensitive channel
LVKNDVAVMLAQRSREQPDLPQVDLDVAWSFFDPEKLGLCSLKRARLLTLGHVQARKNMRATLKNAHDVVDKLRSVVSICINFFVFLCALAIFQLNVLEVWVGISSIILAFSFVFGATLRSIFDSLVFLFAVHAYDVGDKIKMGTDETVYYIRKIHLLSTTMARSDGAVIKFMNWNLLITCVADAGVHCVRGN